MTNSVAVTNSDMSVFDDAEIKRAGELLGVPLDRAAAIRALIIQRDTDLSITRGEISVVEFRGKPQVFVNKNGYLAYASKHPDYRGFKCESGKDDNGIYGYAEVYRSGLDVPISVKRYLAEYDMHREPWTSRPRTMIEKVALSQALRMAFPILGGTYDESEEWDGCNRVVVDPLPTDIDVQPTPAPTPEDPPKQAIETYSLEQAQMILENYGANGFDTAVFERARISDREYDKQMIDADFKRQNEAKKAAKKAESKNVQPQHPEATGPIVSNEVCSVCGKRLLTKDVEDSRKYGKLLCPNCQIDELKARAAAKEATTQSKIEPEFVCTICGKPITKVRKDICEYYQVPVMCTECQKAQEGQHE